MEKLSQLYTECFGAAPLDILLLPSGGSNRKYYRLTGTGGTVIGVAGTSEAENRAFIYLSHHFRAQDLPVPRVLDVSDDGMYYLQEDMGDQTLFDALRSGRESGGNYTPEQVELLKRTIAMLPALQIKGGQGMDWHQCYPVPAMDRQSVMFDLNYFKYNFLKFTGIDFHEVRLETDLIHFSYDLLKDSGETFLYRDFQARNVMLVDGLPRFIDFQGGRRGPMQYDVASFLWQASAKYSPELRRQLIDTYLNALEHIQTIDRDEFMQMLNLFVLFRLMQVLGAYGFRGLFERKKHFLDSIGPALDNLKDLLDSQEFPYPYLTEVLRKVSALRSIQLADTTVRIVRRDDAPVSAGQMSKSQYDGKGPLTVRVFSFSYKKGIPEDTSGNGGGYVFDCRSTHNPGRYDIYKPLTGLDRPVIDFLEDNGEILTFLDSVYALADAHVERYMQRGFTDLMFSFGCTGGRHRSVYSAQHVAEHLHCKYGVRVILEHREQGIKSILE